MAGRILTISFSNTSLKLSVIRDEQVHSVDFSDRPALGEILSEGDLIAVSENRDIVLLAPHKKSLPSRAFNKELLKRWQHYLLGLRSFFIEKEFIEVQTPHLVKCPGTEPSLDVFATSLVVGSRREKLYLPTSPELHLKKALALGAEKIFELTSCFRNGEISERHQPEFLMLEWYRAYADLRSIRTDVIELVQFMAQWMGVEKPLQVQSFSVAELFKVHCHFNFTPQTTALELRELAKVLGVDVRSAESIDDLFFLIFMDKIESQLPSEELVFVKDYPPYQAALARLTEEGWGDRFEVYWKGLELANAFNELNDPYVQRLRAQEDLDKKALMQKELFGFDEEFFQCLEAGMPPSGGIALGVERLFMALMDEVQIKKLRVFPQL